MEKLGPIPRSTIPKIRKYPSIYGLLHKIYGKSTAIHDFFDRENTEMITSANKFYNSYSYELFLPTNVTFLENLRPTPQRTKINNP